MNPVSYFEIPVLDMDRALRFYVAVFGYAFERATVDGNDMAFFPHAEGGSGASGALAKGDSYLPGKSGARSSKTWRATASRCTPHRAPAPEALPQ